MAAEVTNASPGVWATITESAASFGHWVADTATKVWGAVSPYFQAALNHVQNNAEAYTWGAVGVIIGSAITSLIAFIWCKDPKPAVEPAAADGTSAPADGTSAPAGGTPVLDASGVE